MMKKGDVVQCPYGCGKNRDFYPATIKRHGKKLGRCGIWAAFIDEDPKADQFYRYETKVKVIVNDDEIAADNNSNDDDFVPRGKGKKRTTEKKKAMGRKKRTTRKEETSGTAGATGRKKRTTRKEETPGTEGATGAKEVTVENSPACSNKNKLPPPISPANKWEYFEPSGYHVLSRTHWIRYPAGYLLSDGKKTTQPIFHNSVLNTKTLKKSSLFEEKLN